MRSVIADCAFAAAASAFAAVTECDARPLREALDWFRELAAPSPTPR